MKKEDTTLRAVGYCRTSGEKQRDNTSIPLQKSNIEKHINVNGWKFLHHYIDESLSGSKIDGRDDFKRMLKDAAKGDFDIIVIYDISRFARDGSDIIRESSFLKNNFNVHVIDTKGFDTRKPRNALLNFVFAGVAEDERLRIMDRTINARIANAKNGLLWAPKPPFGRAFTKTGKHSGQWSITEDGKKFEKILESYVKDDKSFRVLAREHGIISAQRITRIIREAQLAANPYKAVFHSPEIGIEHLEILIPAVPAVISPALEKRVLAKMSHNQKNIRQHKRDYLLSGLVRCSHCGMFLKGQSQNNRSYYTHNNFYADKKPCPYNGIRLEVLESHVMNYLTEFFFNEPMFDKAIKLALPTVDDREKIASEITSTEKALNKTRSKINNFTKAIGEGEKLSSLLDVLKLAESEKQTLETQLNELQTTLQTMPDPELIKAQAEFIRGKLLVDCLTTEWQKQSHDDLRRFLQFLFSDNPRQNNYGVLLGRQDNKWVIDFAGCFDFAHIVNDGKAEIKASTDETALANRMKAKDQVIKTFGKLEDAKKQAESLKNLISQIETAKTNASTKKAQLKNLKNQLKNTEKELKGSKVFNDKDYLYNGCTFLMPYEHLFSLQTLNTICH